MATFFPDLQRSSETLFAPPKSVVDRLDNPQYAVHTKFWVEAAYEEARQELQQSTDISEVGKYVEYIVGNHWPRGRPSYKAKPVDNRIWRLFWELVAHLTDIRPLWDVRSLNDGQNYRDQAALINNISKAWWLESDSDETLALIIIYALLCTGYGKLEWNENLRHGEGDQELIALGPTSVLPLKPTGSLESAESLFYQCAQPLSFFRRKYGERGKLVTADPNLSSYMLPARGPSTMTPFQFNLLSDAMKRTVGTPAMPIASNFPMALYREMWFRDDSVNDSGRPVPIGRPGANWSYVVQPGYRLYPRGRLLVFGGREIMADEPNPYWHGRYPIAELRMNHVPWQFQGISEMKPLVPLQDIINNVLAGILDMVKRAVNPGFTAPNNAFSEQVKQTLDWSMPGAKAFYSPLAGHQPQFAPQPQLPGFVQNVMTMAMREMDESSGISTVNEAVRKRQIPGADTLEQIKQSQQTPLRLKGRNIEIFMRHIGSMSIFNMFQFYDTRRRYYMFGAKGVTAQDFDWDPGNMKPAGENMEDAARKFMFQVRPGSLLNTDREERATVLLALRKMQDLDRITLYEELDMGIDAKKVNANLQQEIAEKTLPGILKALGNQGAPPPAPPGGAG